MVERCVREHRTLGARYRAVCGTLPLTLHRHGVFGNLKSRSKILLTTYLTTSVENPYFEAWLSLVERCVRDAEVVGSNPVASTTQTALLSQSRLAERFHFYICRNILLPHFQNCLFGSFEGCTVLVRRFFSTVFFVLCGSIFEPQGN